MIFLGIDPGYARLGYGLIEVEESNSKNIIADGSISKTNNHPILLEAGLIETHQDLSHGQRLLEIEENLLSVIKKRKIKFAIIEDVFIKKNITTANKLLEARGIIILTLARLKIEYEFVSPTAVKKMVTGYGKANKKQIQLMIKNILKLKEIPQPDDVADGIALSICAWLGKKNDYIS